MVNILLFYISSNILSCVSLSLRWRLLSALVPGLSPYFLYSLCFNIMRADTIIAMHIVVLTTASNMYLIIAIRKYVGMGGINHYFLFRLIYLV